jgi:hypothetical protein
VIGLQRLPRRRSNVTVQEVGSETWLVSSSAETAHLLNPTARAIWELCDGMTTLDEVAEAICQLFDVSCDSALRDVRAVVDQFAAADLVRLSEAD